MKQSLRRHLAALSLTLLSLPGWAGESGWRVDKDSEGIQIASRAVDGWSIREIRASAVLDARLSSLVAVLADLQALPELTPLVKQTTLLEHRDDTQLVFHTLIDMPWPIQDRDAINQRRIQQDPHSGVVTLIDQAVSGSLPPKPGLIRIQRSRQTWTLSPRADRRVAVEMHLLSDPGGEIPSSLINALSVSTPFHTLSQLRQLASRPVYRDARLDYIQEPAPP